jgi:hypothetical protein
MIAPTNRSFKSILEEREQVKLLVQNRRKRIDEASAFYMISLDWVEKYKKYIYYHEKNPEEKEGD